jgi:SAM-dependent methyltransferase
VVSSQSSSLLHPAPSVYWEERARRFAGEGDGLRAVCAYGMPAFYNRTIDLCQRLALEPWLNVSPGPSVLDVGCGVGRWSRLLASRGALVTGIDLSETMIAQSICRAAREGLSDRCRFLVQDTSSLSTGERFDLVLGVTVLQHILDPNALRAALQAMREHLDKDGYMLLLEAAPTRSTGRCDSPIFRARHRDDYLKLFTEVGLKVHAVTGVDPAPFRYWLLPYLPRLPRGLATAALALATALSAPVDALVGRRAADRSWHAVFVLRRAAPEEGYHAH